MDYSLEQEILETHEKEGEKIINWIVISDRKVYKDIKAVLAAFLNKKDEKDASNVYQISIT